MALGPCTHLGELGEAPGFGPVQLLPLKCGVSLGFEVVGYLLVAMDCLEGDGTGIAHWCLFACSLPFWGLVTLRTSHVSRP